VLIPKVRIKERRDCKTQENVPHVWECGDVCESEECIFSALYCSKFQICDENTWVKQYQFIGWIKISLIDWVHIFIRNEKLCWGFPLLLRGVANARPLSALAIVFHEPKP
jgi:hypothetical protein